MLYSSWFFFPLFIWFLHFLFGGLFCSKYASIKPQPDKSRQICSFLLLFILQKIVFPFSHYKAFMRLEWVVLWVLRVCDGVNNKQTVVV